MAQYAKITIVTLSDARSIETYVGVVAGDVSPSLHRLLADRFEALLEADDGADEDDARVLYFQESVLAETPEDLTEVVNIYPT